MSIIICKLLCMVFWGTSTCFGEADLSSFTDGIIHFISISSLKISWISDPEYHVGLKSIIKYICSGSSSSSFHVAINIFQCIFKGLDSGLCGVFKFYFTDLGKYLSSNCHAWMIPLNSQRWKSHWGFQSQTDHEYPKPSSRKVQPVKFCKSRSGVFNEKLVVERQVMSTQECLHKCDSSGLVLLEELV